MIYQEESSIPSYLLCCVCLQISKIPAICSNSAVSKLINAFFANVFAISIIMTIFCIIYQTICKCEYCGLEIKYHRFQRHRQKCQDNHDFVTQVQSQFQALEQTIKCFSCQQLALSPQGCQKCDKINCYVCYNNFRRLKNNCCNLTEFRQIKEEQLTKYKIFCINCNLITELKYATHHLKKCRQKPKNYFEDYTVESLRNIIFKEGFLFYKIQKTKMQLAEQQRYDIRIIMAELYQSEYNIKQQKKLLKNIEKRKKIYEKEN